MRALFRILSSLLAGSMLAAVNFAPALEVRRFVKNRKRFIYAILLSIFAVLMMCSAALVGLIDLVIQFERQGAMVWNGLLTALTVIFGVSVLMLITARAILPSVRDFMIRASGEDLVAGFQTLIHPLIQHWHHAAQAAAQASAPTATPASTETPRPAPVRGPAATKDTPSRRAPELAPI